MGRLLVVSNRLPVTLSYEDGAPRVVRSIGGVATGLSTAHATEGSLWIGWPGAPRPEEREVEAALTCELEAARLVPVWLPAEVARRSYEGYSNGVLWPLFHYLVDRVPLHVRDWDAYVQTNEAFATAVAAEHRPGDTVWIHDYQLMLVPAMLREAIPEVRCGFFLHVPFPSEEIFRTLPQRASILEGLLGADLVGFHAPAYLRHLSSSLLEVLGLSPGMDQVVYEDRVVRIATFPMGIDASRFAEVAEHPDVRAEAERARVDGCRVLLGVDRLDYTKGIPRRLLAYERLLEAHPELRGRVRLVQVAVPSRATVDAYQSYRQRVDEAVGRINGRFGTAHWVPIHPISRSLSETEVVALYRSADVMLVTSLRDGMNLVAKEFVATRTDGDGVLVLSEFAGAAAELAEALTMSPYDVDGSAEVLYRAIEMEESERRARMAALRGRVTAYDVRRWTEAFLAALGDAVETRHAAPSGASSDGVPGKVLSAVRAATHVALLLDYDGTLVPLARSPSLARPDRALRELLTALALLPGVRVHVVSGRMWSELDQWLGDVPVALHAEHGAWSRTAPGSAWVCRQLPPLEWKRPVRALLDDAAARTPGSLVEEKTTALAWHWRGSDPEFGERQARALAAHLLQVLSNAPVEVLQGDHVIEVRPHGATKAAVVVDVAAQAGEGAILLAIGDDRTDEDMFGALPAGSLSVRVGAGATTAALRLPDVAAVRRLLAALVAGRATGPVDAAAS